MDESMRKCSVCKKEFPLFVPIEKKYIVDKSVESELLNRDEYSCPYCYSPDRDRMIVCFLEKLHERVKTGISILEIAPSGALERYINRFWGESNRYTADLFMDDVDFQADLQDMKEIEDKSFDFIVCSHVLEHVQDDRMAIRELYRVLKDYGLGIIIVPLNLKREVTDEEWGLPEEENIRRFGQKDHVRAYNKADFLKRLSESGFGVHSLDKSFFGEKTFEENAFTSTSTIYLVYKDLDKYKNLCDVIDLFAKWVDPKTNYWIDVCDIHENKLRLWGWAYFEELESRYTKFKLLLFGEKKYIFGLHVRKRTDIADIYGGKYLFSGIDVLADYSEIEKGYYKVFIKLASINQREKLIECGSVSI